MGRRLRIPYGFQDLLPKECYAKKRLEAVLTEIYGSYGYNEVETPTIEYYDAFHDVYAPDKLKKMFKMTDSDGSLLALRPDITLQVCRMASKLDLNYPQRLFYAENCFEYFDNGDTARSREFAQVGVELIGDSGIDGEIEIITLAVQSFLACGLVDFKIDIGNNNFFKGLISEIGLNKKDIAQLTEFINKKDFFAIEVFLQSKKIASEFCDKLLLLPSLFGGREVFAKAESICNNKLSLSAFENIKTLYDALKEIGYEQYVSIDFGMLHGLDYYSGLVLKGYSKNFGLCLLDGGRYDGLCPSFGFDGKAVGFAIGVKRLLSALNETGRQDSVPTIDYAYFSDNADRKTEMSFTEILRKKGFRVLKIFCKDKSALFEYCKQNKIRNACIIYNKDIIEFGEEDILCQT
ncbi:MAG: ATP phosphoribosyltransferase regulatory subunit [Clostridia bacterium]|nr:ATP phosphoribosyltransferase regulatory subunit [Clostridia bacterium]